MKSDKTAASDTPPDIGVSELCRMWRNAEYDKVIDVLVVAHPCLTAALLVQGSIDNKLNRTECCQIANLLIERKMNENEQQLLEERKLRGSG